MGFASSTQNKNNLQNTIRSKQQLYSRFNRRFNASKSANERMFIKQEMNRICKELTTCAQQWKNCGFGTNNWVTKNFGPKSNNTARTNSSSSRSRSNNSSRSTAGSTRKSTRSNTKSNKRTTSSTTRKPSTWSFGRSFTFSR